MKKTWIVWIICAIPIVKTIANECDTLSAYKEIMEYDKNCDCIRKFGMRVNPFSKRALTKYTKKRLLGILKGESADSIYHKGSILFKNRDDIYYEKLRSKYIRTRQDSTRKKYIIDSIVKKENEDSEKKSKQTHGTAKLKKSIIAIIAKLGLREFIPELKKCLQSPDISSRVY